MALANNLVNLVCNFAYTGEVSNRLLELKPVKLG